VPVGIFYGDGFLDKVRGVDVRARIKERQAMDNAELQDAVNASGFPLQLGVKILADTPKWRVLLWEHPWEDPVSNTPKFMDVVINGQRPSDAEYGFQTMVVECKRARDTAWIFLRESNESQANHRLVIRARVIAKRENVDAPLINEWVDVPCRPASPIADYCVIRKKTNKEGRQEILEPVAAEVVRATEALAREEISLCEATRARLSRVYIPMIVTTAKLFICDANYADVDFDTGEIDDATIASVPYLRFSKSLGQGKINRFTRRLEDVSRQSERSVLVVQAGSLLSFLDACDLGDLPYQLKEALFGYANTI
jgi:hypothetical protein